jgi:hypothetical protein
VVAGFSRKQRFPNEFAWSGTMSEIRRMESEGENVIQTLRNWLEYRRIHRALKPSDEARRFAGIKDDVHNAAGEAWDLAACVEDGGAITFDRIKELAKGLDVIEARLIWVTKAKN